MACFKSENDLYLLDCQAVWKEFPELIKFIPEFCKRNGYNSKSRIYVEPKASGKSIIQQIQKETRYNIIEDKTLKDLQGNKFARVNAISAIIESKRIFLPEGRVWVDTFLHECLTFPNGKHDDKVDCLVMAVNKELQQKIKRGYSIGNLRQRPNKYRGPRDAGNGAYL